MQCNNDGGLCGILTVESGLGSGNYQGSPKVHGLWPEVGEYGNSKCCTGSNCSNNSPAICSSEVPKWNGCDPNWGGCSEGANGGCSANQQQGINLVHQKNGCNTIVNDKSNACWFPAHEWYKHGMCAGFQDSVAYTTAMHNLGAGPISYMAKGNKDWEQEKINVCKSTYGDKVYKFDEENKQIQFSVSATPPSNNDSDAKWDFWARDGNNACSNMLHEGYVGVL